MLTRLELRDLPNSTFAGLTMVGEHRFDVKKNLFEGDARDVGETRDTTVEPSTPPQFTSRLTSNAMSLSFADLRTHVAKRGAAFTGRVAITPNSSAKPRQTTEECLSPMKRVSSTPSFSTPSPSSTPAPGSQGMRDMFFVRQDNINFNASYGTPVKEVSTDPLSCPNALRTTPAPFRANLNVTCPLGASFFEFFNRFFLTLSSHPPQLTGSREAVGVPRAVRDLSSRVDVGCRGNEAQGGAR